MGTGEVVGISGALSSAGEVFVDAAEPSESGEVPALPGEEAGIDISVGQLTDMDLWWAAVLLARCWSRRATMQSLAKHCHLAAQQILLEASHMEALRVKLLC